MCLRYELPFYNNNVVESCIKRRTCQIHDFVLVSQYVICAVCFSINIYMEFDC